MDIIGQEKPSLDNLEHFGIKGMKWGSHKTSGTTVLSQRQKLRQLNKKSKASDKVSRNAEIDAARQKYNTQARANYVKAVKQYKIDKNVIGSREARKKLNAVKAQNLNDFEIASQTKHGKEAVIAVLGVVGTVALATALSAAANSR